MNRATTTKNPTRRGLIRRFGRRPGRGLPRADFGLGAAGTSRARRIRLSTPRKAGKMLIQITRWKVSARRLTAVGPAAYVTAAAIARPDRRSRSIRRAMQPESETAVFGLDGIRHQRVARRGADPFPEPVGKTQDQHQRPGVGQQQQRFGDRRKRISEDGQSLCVCRVCRTASRKTAGSGWRCFPPRLRSNRRSPSSRPAHWSGRAAAGRRSSPTKYR